MIKIKPTEDNTSECYQCEAGMCDVCSLRKNWDDWNYAHRDDLLLVGTEEEKPKRGYFKCTKCHVEVEYEHRDKIMKPYSMAYSLWGWPLNRVAEYCCTYCGAVEHFESFEK